MSRANILFFGESGAGKSSIINMLCDSEHVAQTSHNATGCTFESTGYDTDILDTPVRLWDTAGLNEGDAGRVPHSMAIIQLYRLLRTLSNEGGVHLLVFVLRGPRLSDVASKNWALFYEIICQREVPGVVALTGMEVVEDRKDWWLNNKEVFYRCGIKPEGHACITTIRGKHVGEKRAFDGEYERSRQKIIRLIKSTCLEPGNGWMVPPVEWFGTVVELTWKSKGCGTAEQVKETRKVAKKAFRDLQKLYGLSARELAEKLKD